MLNIIIRIPTYPHEAGSDSFHYHSLAKSISDQGFAPWTTNPAGFFGDYGASKFPGVKSLNLGSGKPSSLPFFLSGISLLAGINMEITILVSAILLGVLAAVFSFALAKEVMDDDVFAFITAFSFSLSPLILVYGIWTASSRYFFIILILFFLMILLKRSSQIEHVQKMKYLLLLIILIVLLFATHRMSLLIPMILIAYIISIAVKKLNGKLYVKNKPLKIFIPWIILFFVLFLPQIFKLGFFKTYKIWANYQSGYFFTGTEWYTVFLNMVIDYASNIGVLVIYCIPGLFYLLNKDNKKISELFLIYFLLIFSAVSSYGTYMTLFILPFTSLLIAVSFVNIAKIPRGKIFSSTLAAILIISIVFSLFMMWHWQVLIPTKDSDAYMREDTYNTILFLNNYNNATSMTSTYERQFHAFLNSGFPTVYHTILLDYGYDNDQVQQFIDKHSISYHIEKNSMSGCISDFAGVIGKVKLFMYIVEHKNRIYNNGELSVWYFGDV